MPYLVEFPFNIVTVKL